MISIIIPTIDGREKSLARTKRAYRQTSPTNIQLIVVKNEPSWPAACNRGFLRADWDILHFTADDLVPVHGWWQEAVEWLKHHDELPAPKVMNFRQDGEWDNAEDGPDKAIPHFTRIPIMTRDQYERIGPWPEYNYVADVWLSEKARTLGIETRMIHSYAFVHHWNQTGRVDSPRQLDAANRQLAHLRRGLRRT